MTDYRAGFDTLDAEVAAALPVRGRLPDWLAGTLVRNGPAVFEHGGRSLRHWFDGQAMLHRFAIGDGGVRYTNRLLDTPSLRSLRERGRIGYTEFATDPCGSLFGRFFSRFHRRPSANACVNVTTVGGEPAAVSEVPLAVTFDPRTLDTLGVTDYSAGIDGTLTTAHPHALPDGGDLVNYVLRFGRHSEYQFYRRPPSAAAGEVIGRYRTEKPGYVHSFAVTRRHIVLAVFPLVVNPLSFLLRGRPFIENYAWRPEEGLRVVVLDAAGGGVVAEHTAPAAFAFHHINAYDDGDTVVMDLCAFDDAAIVSALYVDALRAGRPVPVSWATRYTVPLGAGEVTVRRLSDEPFELPRIHYGAHNGRPYRYAYGVGAADPTGANFLDQLVKLDVTTGRTTVWRAEGGYPGEPVFVPAPTAAAEDDGVVLSVVLDARRGASTLVVLDGATFTELARADVPHVIPFGFHGQFARQEH
ncbi:carotenoid oxygenase family protein [Micromonospora sp. DT31]|uniref:carotenoid oxygenase family protein n=1 Tax=Micromonospora sp. DT31 TaxID=3393434 RepID=UPI003CF81FA1